VQTLTNDTYLRIVNAKLYIDKNYHEQIDLEVVSKQAFISKFHFHRLFRRIYQKTPLEYITKKRIDKAKEMLSENKPVTEVCNEVGFESITSFSNLFKKEIGFPPTYYRNMAWLKKQEAMRQPKRFIPGCFIETFKFDK
jgi:AraC-like DNA-binding protein